MKVNIKIHRDRNRDGSYHNGIIEFENGLNIYQATFELTNEK